ncbi:uncharacterized protein TNCV_78871 [Trichonephila clavipes]|nr:uncharacterized protein TNCV_78871 [Trichonephila clavipes]
MEARWSERRVARKLGRSDCVVRRYWDVVCWTSGSESCHLHKHQAQDVLDKPIVKKTTTSDEFRFNISSDDNRVRVWRSRGKHLNPAFVLQRHITPTAGVMVWGVIAYNTRSSLVLIRGPMTVQRHVHNILQPYVLPIMQRLSLRSRFSTGQGSASHGKGITRLSPHCYYHSLTCLIPRCVSNRAYLESFGSVSWVSHELERTRGKVYEKDKDTFDISQSADPTCDGLVSPRDGSRIMKLTKTKHPTSGCQFPSWVTSTRHWHTLDGRMNYYFSHRNNSYRIVHQHTSHAETKVTCTDEVYSSPNSTTVVAYSMQGW